MTLVVLLAVLSACSNDDTYLPALLADPMANYEAEEPVLSDSWECGQRSSFLGGGPVQAEVGRTYRIEDQSQAKQLLDDAGAFAESEGWTMSNPLTGRPDFYRGIKELVPRELHIHMEFHPVPTEG